MRNTGASDETMSMIVATTMIAFTSVLCDANLAIPFIIAKSCIICPMALSRRERVRRSFRRQRTTTKIMIVFGVLVAASSLFTILLFAFYARDLPAPGKLLQVSSSSTTFYDRNDKPLFEIYKDTNRVPVKLSDISDYAQDATIAIEDKNFYRHKGISETGIIRAFFSIVTRQGVQGGSTITQQLIKNVLLGSDRSPARKIKEAILAIEVERRYTKDQILELYLNEIPYGGTYYGIGSASQGYFGKPAKNLSILESAFLAGLPQSPSYYSPFIGSKDAWKTRTKDVLRRMREDDYITKKEHDDAVKSLEKLRFTEPKLSINAPHFVYFTKDLVEKEFGVKIIDKGIRIKTTLDSELQNKVQAIVKEEVEKLKGSKVGNGAAVVLDANTGDVLAMVGSYDYNNKEYGKFNAATGQRQPGSSIKPITYALAFEKGYTPSTVIMDLNTKFPDQGDKDYEPVNYDGKFRGPVQLRFALGNSYNIPAVKLLAMVGISDFMKKASMMGLENFEPTQTNMNRYGLAVTLGGAESTLLDMTSAFGTFARGGEFREYIAVQEVKDAKGKSLFKASASSKRRVFSPEVSYLVSHILSDNVARTDAFGSNSYLRIPGKTVAVKTGTTNDKRDNWTIGYTKDVVVGVWVGNNDNSPMDSRIASGVTGASPIWSRIMSEVLKGGVYKDGIAEKPSRIKSLQIDAYLGGLPKDGYPTRAEFYVEGTEPKDVSPFYKKLKISKSNGKLANDLEIRAGNYDEKEFIVITETDPVSQDGKNMWQEAIDAWAREQGEKGNEKFKYSTETSDANQDSVVVNVTEPKNESRIGSGAFTLKARITSNEKVKKIRITANGTELKSIDGDNKEISENITLPDGVYDVKVTATNEKDKNGESSIRLGINQDWNQPVSTPTPSPTP